MRLLMVDTTDREASIALHETSGVVTSRRLLVTDGISAQLIPAIDELLASREIKLPQIDVFGAVTGPGSFTGIRVGLAAIQGFAEVFGKPVVGISRLAALAAAAGGEFRAPILDARRGEVYAAVYSRQGAPAIPESNLPWGRFLEAVGSRAVTFVAQFPAVFAPGGVAPLPPGAASVVPAQPLAYYAAQLALSAPRIAPEHLEANYIRRSDAELKWSES